METDYRYGLLKDTRISEIIKNEGLFRKRRMGVNYGFIYAKKVIFPQDKDDTDLDRFNFFLYQLKNIGKRC